MNFYFCEVCGKRLTDIDIEQGKGRDKKLKGVYCSICSVGVTTQETMPITDKQIQEALKKRPSAIGITPAAPTQAGTSNKSMRPAVTETSSVSRTSRTSMKRNTTPGGGSSATLVLGGGGVLAAVIAVVAFSGGSKPTPRDEPLKPAPVVRVADNPAPTPAPALNPPPAPARDEPRSAITRSATADAEVSAQQAYLQFMLAIDRVKSDPAAKIAASDEFLKEHGETIVGARVRVMQRQWKNELNAPAAPQPAGSTSAAGAVPAQAGKLITRMAHEGGDWIKILGKSGYVLYGVGADKGDIKKLPPYIADVDINTLQRSLWTAQANLRGMEMPGGGRIAACAYSTKDFTVTVRFGKAQPTRVSLFFSDYNAANRKGRVEIYSGEKLLDSAPLVQYSGGLWYQLDITGDIAIKVVSELDRNIVMSGVFFDVLDAAEKK